MIFLEKIKKFLSQIILAVLIAIYFIATPRTEKSIETVLLNPKYNPEKITLNYAKEGRAVLSKCGGFWICDYTSPQGKTAAFPCDSITVENMIQNAKKIVKVYEISDNLNKKEKFALSQEDAFCIEFSENGKIVSKLFFGAADSRRRIAFYAESQSASKHGTKIYSTDSSFLNYLNASPDFWCAPEIFPKSVCGDLSGAVAIKPVDINVSEVSRLRHGKIFLGDVPKSQNVAELQIEIDDGKGNFYKAFFVPVVESADGGEEGDYYCRFIATPSTSRPAEEKFAIEKFDYITTISAWTYNKLRVEN